MHRHRPFCTACYSGLRPNSLQTIKTYWSLWANASFGGPGPTPARDAAGIEAAPPNPSRPWSSHRAPRTCSPDAVRVPELTSKTDIKLNMRVSLRPIQTSLAWLQSRRLAPHV